MKRTIKDKNGITLIALVITIIVLLILAGVTIVTLTGDNGLITKANEAKSTNLNAEIGEKIKLAYSEWQIEKFTANEENVNDFIKNNLNNIYKDNSIVDIDQIGNLFIVTFLDGKTYACNISAGKTTDLTNTTNISKIMDENFVGYYADVDIDGVIDGVIFADLLVGSIKETQQVVNSYGTYMIPIINSNELRDYYISQENYEGVFGKKGVLSPKGSGKNRFYIISLDDFKISSYDKFYWYKNAINMNDYSTQTSNDFGTGKTNTDAILKKWNNSEYGPQYEQDIWNYMQEKVNNNWFIPSRGELAAFVNELGIEKSNYKAIYRFSDSYWSSSQYNKNYTWYIRLWENNKMAWNDNISYASVLLATTI